MIKKKLDFEIFNCILQTFIFGINICSLLYVVFLLYTKSLLI